MPESVSRSPGRHRVRFRLRPVFASLESVAARGALSLAEADALLSDGRLSNLWKLYRLGRSQVPHPARVENASRINLELEKRFQANGVNEIQRFFKKHPEIAIWSAWVERALRRVRPKPMKVRVLKLCLRIFWGKQAKKASLARHKRL